MYSMVKLHKCYLQSIVLEQDSDSFDFLNRTSIHFYFLVFYVAIKLSYVHCHRM
jgi:hypothetical protein